MGVAVGGAALVFVEATAVTPDGRISPGDAVFRDVLLFLRLTPARPSVVREMTWDMINWDTSLVVKHHTNIRRLLTGTENRLGSKHA